MLSMTSMTTSFATVCGDIQPVQYQGKSWKPISYEDHTFDQSRTNAVYPMTHLFLDNTPNSHKSIKDDPNTIHITRTGRPALLINLAFFEPETTFRTMNELLYLLTQPSLDNVFRNSVTGKLKCIFAFLVDNGHGEDPDSPLTQMCLVRILHMFSLTKISQRSFAEYHSKRNFVERVHASENTALSRRGCFRSKQVHPNAETGSKEDIENMEKNGISCILRTRLSKIYRFEIPFLTVYLVNKCFRTFRGGPWPHATPP